LHTIRLSAHRHPTLGGSTGNHWDIAQRTGGSVMSAFVRSWSIRVAVVLGLLALAHPAAAQVRSDLTEQEKELEKSIQAELLEQQARQKAIQEETEFTVHRLDAMMRAVKFYRLDKKAEAKAIDDMKFTLARLSKVQMND